MTQKKVNDYPQMVIGPERLNGRIDFADVFGRSGRVELEVGSGKGTFLLEQAKAFPDALFVGIEWANKYYKYAVDRTGRWGLSNVRLLRTDAAPFIREHLQDGSIRVFHLYFPDPWPKKKHHKRRFFSDENLPQLHRILEPGGLINAATDHEEYYHQMCDVAARATASGLFEQADFMRPAGARPGETVGTNYERKYMKEGRQTYTIALRKPCVKHE